MLRNKLISLLIKEGFSHKTLSAFTDPQLKQLAKKILSEVEKSTVQKTTYSKSEVDQMKRNHGGVSVDDGTVTFTSCSIYENTARYVSVYISSGTVTFTQTNIYNNKARGVSANLNSPSQCPIGILC